jgi:hypothetical protein
MTNFLPLFRICFFHSGGWIGAFTDRYADAYLLVWRGFVFIDLVCSFFFFLDEKEAKNQGLCLVAGLETRCKPCAGFKGCLEVSWLWVKVIAAAKNLQKTAWLEHLFHRPNQPMPIMDQTCF